MNYSRCRGALIQTTNQYSAIISICPNACCIIFLLYIEFFGVLFKHNLTHVSKIHFNIGPFISRLRTAQANRRCLLAAYRPSKSQPPYRITERNCCIYVNCVMIWCSPASPKGLSTRYTNTSHSIQHIKQDGFEDTSTDVCTFPGSTAVPYRNAVR